MNKLIQYISNRVRDEGENKVVPISNRMYEIARKLDEFEENPVPFIPSKKYLVHIRWPDRKFIKREEL